VFGQINISGDYKVGKRHGSSERSLPFVVGLLGLFVVEHYGVVEVINYFLRVFFQIISIEGVQYFFVKENGIEILCLHKQPATRYHPLRQLLDAAIDTTGSEGIDVNGYTLPETRPVRIIGYNKKLHFSPIP
jgi:hypothetical protein